MAARTITYEHRTRSVRVALTALTIEEQAVGPDTRRGRETCGVQGSPVDGFKVDEHGNLWASGPDGVFVMNADGCLLGTIHLPEIANNVAFGREDGKTLYIPRK